MATEEIELLEAMFPEELKVINSTKLEITLRPRTDLDSSQGIFVFITLIFSIPQDYPSVPPVMELKNARGIDEEGTVKLINNLKKKAGELQGSPVLFELIQLARDLLTENNRPHEDCPICLIPFEENEDFVKTPCFHYFHNDCFMSYCQTSVGDLRCPLCREMLSGEFLTSIITPTSETDSSVLIPSEQPTISSSPPSPPISQPRAPEHPPSRFIVVTNLGNEKKLDWQGAFDNIFKLYAAQSMIYLNLTTVIIEFKEISHAEIAVANTDNSSIAGQKISCKYASPNDTELYDSAKQSEEITQQLRQLSLQYEKEHQDLLNQDRPQPLPTQEQAPVRNNLNKEQIKLRNPRPKNHNRHHPRSHHSSSSSTSSSSSPSLSTTSTSSSTSQPLQQPQPRTYENNHSNNNNRQPRKVKTQRPPNSNNSKKKDSHDVPVKS